MQTTATVINSPISADQQVVNDTTLRPCFCKHRATASGGLFGKLSKVFWSAAGAAVFVRLYCMPMRSNALPEVMLLQPTW